MGKLAKNVGEGLKIYIVWASVFGAYGRSRQNDTVFIIPFRICSIGTSYLLGHTFPIGGVLDISRIKVEGG